MIEDVKTGKRKTVKAGQCMICNGEPHHSVLGAHICNTCLPLMADETGEAISERMVWDD